MTQYLGWPELLFGAGTFILGVLVAWAILRNKYRNRANDLVTDAVVREEYRHPSSYNPEKFRRELGPKS
jgi:hypothetical protein